MTIWKFKIECTQANIIKMPCDAEILCAQVQFNALYIWAKVSEDAQLKPRTIEVFGTGCEIPDGTRRFISTVQFNGGHFVFHIFERTAV